MDDDFAFFAASRASEGEDFPIAEEEESNELSQSTFKGDWKKVVELYEVKEGVQRSAITSSKDTALHMAISDDREDVVEKMVGAIVNNHNTEALKMKNNRGETPLHRAATRKSVTMCRCIFEAGLIMGLDLLTITNEWGETPIFTAALHNRKPTFFFLHVAAFDAYRLETEKRYQILIRTDGSGDTALHTAIMREHFDMAFHIILMYPHLVGKSNEKGMTPLQVLASKPSAFRSGLRLSWWKQIIYYFVKNIIGYWPRQAIPSGGELRGKKEGDSEDPNLNEPYVNGVNENIPQNYTTLYELLVSVCHTLIRFSGFGKMKLERDLEATNSSHVNKNIPPNYTTCFEFLFSVCLNLFRLIKSDMITINIYKEKEKHEWSVQILKLLMEKHNEAYITEGGDPTRRGKIFDPRRQKLPSTDAQVQKGSGGDTDKEPEAYTPLLVAAQNGVIEVVNEILSQLPVTIYETTSKGKNILQVAMQNRQPNVVEAVHKKVNKELMLNLWDDLVESVDSDGNNILHLAAKYELQIQGSSAIQMQHEVKWYEYVKSFLPYHFTFLTNKVGETPGEIFLRRHKGLVEKSEEWLSRTSESCSVVAALVAGVTFATSSTVPGGNDDKTGKPTLEGHAGFDTFAVTALTALCFSVTALIMFLSILTSKKKPSDFSKKLPVKLFLAISSLFVSIFSMFISFCAAHSFVLEDKFKKSLLPLYVIVCLPVAFTIVEFPLYMDLFRGLFMKVQPYDQVLI